MVRLIKLIEAIARMRDEYPFTDEDSFVKIEPDDLTRRPRLTVVFMDQDNDMEVTLSRILRDED